MGHSNRSLGRGVACANMIFFGFHCVESETVGHTQSRSKCTVRNPFSRGQTSKNVVLKFHCVDAPLLNPRNGFSTSEIFVPASCHGGKEWFDRAEMCKQELKLELVCTQV